MSVARVLQFLHSAQAHARKGCDRTRQMVQACIAKFRALMMIERVAS